MGTSSAHPRLPGCWWGELRGPLHACCSRGRPCRGEGVPGLGAQGSHCRPKACGHHHPCSLGRKLQPPKASGYLSVKWRNATTHTGSPGEERT